MMIYVEDVRYHMHACRTSVWHPWYHMFVKAIYGNRPGSLASRAPIYTMFLNIHIFIKCICVYYVYLYICIGKENKYAMSDMCIYIYICIDYIVSAM